MKINIFFLLTISFAFTITGCSSLNFVKYFKQSNPITWNILSNEEDDAYAYECNCDSFSLRIKTLDRGSWALIGPPLIPIIPVDFLSSEPDTSIIFFYIEISTPDSVANEAPEIALSTDSGKSWIFPFNVEKLLENLFIQQRGNPPGRIRQSQFPNGHLRTVQYRFRIPEYPPETIQIKFFKPYYGCNIPTILYEQSSETQYRAIYMPPLGY